ncbi:hypothetical protein JHK84_044609 [Glycine max]|uniref:uncharacterized protein LOC114390443 n=1 Tax=Glycine soja TaxID=3848 RepID=UPI00103A2572|nr:uncharacterized protein LOC114390443 [Glycine soja]KAG5107702.1 hypothetical protein JHK84_044609 [Glycine max]
MKINQAPIMLNLQLNSIHRLHRPKNLTTNINQASMTTSRQNSNKGDTIGNNNPLPQIKHIIHVPISTQPTNHSIPSNNIPLRHFIEQPSRHRNRPILRIQVNQRGPENHSISKSNPFHHHKLMNPFPELETTRPGTCGQHRRQGGATGLKALPNHILKQIQSLVGAEILSVPTNHSGPKTRTFLRHFIKHATGTDAVSLHRVTPNQSINHVGIKVQPEFNWEAVNERKCENALRRKNQES